MKSRLKLLYQEFLNTVKKPTRILAFMKNPAAALRIISLKLRLRDSWTQYKNRAAFKTRVYHTYDDYVAHQQSKLELINLSDYDVQYRTVLRKRLKQLPFLKSGTSVLCLAARAGTEVRAFMDIGCFAVGIDLNPGKKNQYVLPGDFHNIQFPSDSVDVVFTNSLDHVFDIKKVLAEIARVLKPGGISIIEAAKGSSEGNPPCFFESFWWSKIDELVSLFEESEFGLLERFPIDFPCKGELLYFRKIGCYDCFLTPDR